MSWFQVLYVAGSIAQAYGNLYSAYAQKAAYDAKLKRREAGVAEMIEGLNNYTAKK